MYACAALVASSCGLRGGFGPLRLVVCAWWVVAAEDEEALVCGVVMGVVWKREMMMMIDY